MQFHGQSISDGPAISESRHRRFQRLRLYICWELTLYLGRHVTRNVGVCGCPTLIFEVYNNE